MNDLDEYIESQLHDHFNKEKIYPDLNLDRFSPIFVPPLNLSVELKISDNITKIIGVPKIKIIPKKQPNNRLDDSKTTDLF